MSYKLALSYSDLLVLDINVYSHVTFAFVLMSTVVSNFNIMFGRSAGVAPEVNLREHVTHIPLPSANQAAHSGFETQKRCHDKSKTGISVALQKGLMSSKNFF